MRRFEVGDPVRIDISDEDDPDHDRLHGRRGRVVGILEDDAGQETADQRDSHLFSVELEDGTVEDLRWRDLRPVPESDS
jgi:ribosomal protein L21E